jgi:hypothetical protein
MINLCECKPGDCLVARNGTLFFYSEYRKNGVYKHIIKRRLNGRYALWSVNDEGKHLVNEDHYADIIKIIPQETPNFYFTTYEQLRLYKRTSEIA